MKRIVGLVGLDKNTARPQNMMKSLKSGMILTVLSWGGIRRIKELLEQQSIISKLKNGFFLENLKMVLK